MSYEYLKTKLNRADIAFVYDEGVDPAWARLRVLPAIRYLGVSHFTLPKRWRQLASPEQYDYLDYGYELLGNIEISDTALCSITSQNYEDHTEYTIQPLLTRYQSLDAPLVVAAERRDFYPRGGQRQLEEQPFVESLGSYAQLYQTFSDQYEDAGLKLPLQDTMNLYLQDNANIYKLITGDEVSSTEDLFARLLEAPYLPLYQVFVDIFARNDEPGSSPLPSYGHIEALGRWLRQRIEWDRQTGLAHAKQLNRAVDENERIFDTVTRDRCTDRYDIDRVAESLDAGRSGVHTRYKRWLQEVGA